MKTGIAKRMMIFIDETDRFHGASLSGAIVERLRKEGCSGATVLRGATGFGVHGQVHTSAIVDLAVGLPVVIIAVDDAELIDRVLPIVDEMVSEGLILIDDVQAIRKNAKSEQSRTKPQPAVASDTEHAVSEYMDDSPVTIAADKSFAEVVDVLISNQRAHIPVVSESGVLLGMISSQDLLGRIVHIPSGPFRFFSLRGNEGQQASEDIRELRAAQVMRTQYVAIEPNAPMVKAVQIMLREKLSALPVVQQGKLVGILRLPDVLRKALAVAGQGAG